MDSSDHPGFMVYRNGSIEVLHAEWPVYPAGHGWEVALRALAALPSSFRFLQIDSIDRCLLFEAVSGDPPPRRLADPFDVNALHVAIWEEDLTCLCQRGFVSGCALLTDYEAALSYYQRMKDVVFETAGGPQSLEPPQLEVGADDNRPRTLEVSNTGIRLTATGELALPSIIRPLESLALPIRGRSIALVSLSLFDTAVRDAGVVLEASLREASASTAFGQKLVEAYIERVRQRNGGQMTAYLKVLRTELRTLFKFVRNEFAHALREISSDQCAVLLQRFSDSLEAIAEVERAD